MNATYLRLELKRFFRDPMSVFFIAILPTFFFVVFGAVQEWSAQPAGNGNVGMYVMIGMAAYGAVTATVSIGSAAAVERMQGWGRQLGLTPMRDATFIATKACVGVIVALIPVTLIYGLGALTGSRGDTRVWVLSLVVILVAAAVFSAYGLIFGQLLRGESAIGAATGSLVVLAFLGNLFFPLTGMMLTIAKFTPLYGYTSLARRALTDGYQPSAVGGSDALTFEPLWQPVTGVVVWTVLLAVVAIAVVRRGRRRQ